MKEVIIDVREADEYAAQHVPGSISLPLSNFNHLAPGILSNLADAKVVIMCRGGKRAEMARTQAVQLGLEPSGGFHVFPGGILAWSAAGQPVVTNRKRHLPILRQTLLAAGTLNLLGVILGFTVAPAFFLISGFVGAGLAFAGASGICLMSEVLAVMPWNAARPELAKELCITRTGTGDCAGN